MWWCALFIHKNFYWQIQTFSKCTSCCMQCLMLREEKDGFIKSTLQFLKHCHFHFENLFWLFCRLQLESNLLFCYQIYSFVNLSKTASTNLSRNFPSRNEWNETMWQINEWDSTFLWRCVLAGGGPRLIGGLSWWQELASSFSPNFFHLTVFKTEKKKTMS